MCPQPRVHPSPPATARRFLGGLTADQFLAEYWQKQPLLVRGAVPKYKSPLTPEELAGLACEREVESRVVVFDGTTWHVETGPFKSRTFPKRGKENWTLLVQDLDEHVPAVGKLLSHLDFLPPWRIDDIMASFAVPGGSVGPHYDEYDVFLLQVSGRRRWQLSTQFSRDKLRSDSNLRLLDQFEPDQEWILEPGDLLYLPPHVAHFGVAQTSCVTFSLGCRAPSHTDLVAQMAGMFLAELNDGFRYTDQDLQHREGTQGLSHLAVQRTMSLLNSAWHVTPDLAARCLGTVATTPKLLFRQDDDVTVLDDQQLATAWRARGGLFRRKGSRWSWYMNNHAYLFVDGREHILPESNEQSAAFLQTLCMQRHLTSRWLRSLTLPQTELVQQLIRYGQLLDSE